MELGKADRDKRPSAIQASRRVCVAQTVEPDDHSEAGPNGWIARRREIKACEERERPYGGPYPECEIVGSSRREDQAIDPRAIRRHRVEDDVTSKAKRSAGILFPG